MVWEVLDVGCGMNPRGDVNCDIYKYENPQLGEKSMKMPFGKIPNFVLASGEYLPFRDRSFKHAKSIHVIEHSNNPFKFLKETIRVSKETISIICPHRFDRQAKDFPGHKHSFNVTWFQKALQKLEGYVKSYEIDVKYKPLISPVVHLISFPNEIKVFIERK